MVCTKSVNCFWISLIILFLITSCSDLLSPVSKETEEQVKVTGVELSSNTETLNIGSSISLTANVLPTNATNKGVTWSSEKPLVASVSASGLITGLSEGTTKISVKTLDGGYEDTVNIIVERIEVIGVEIEIESTTVFVGNSIQLSATILPENATNKNATWSSGDSLIASVSSNGMVTGVAEGSTTVSISTEDGGYTDSIAIMVERIIVTGIEITTNASKVYVDNSIQLSANVYPSNATNKNTTWSSDDSLIASVSSTGLVTGVAEGSAIIRVESEDGGFSDSISITVEKYYKDIGVSYVAPDGLTVTLNSLSITEKTGSFQYVINYTLQNNTADQAIDEGTFKLFGPNSSLDQYGFFSRLYPGDSRTRSYTFEALKTEQINLLQYHHDHFFADEPFEDSLKWEVNY